MKRTFLKALFISCILLQPVIQVFAQQAEQKKYETFSAKEVGQFNGQQQPILFTENKGQISDNNSQLRSDILFSTHSGKTGIFITPTSIYYQFAQVDYPNGYEQDPRLVKDKESQQALRRQINHSIHRFAVSLEGANPTPRVRKEGESAYTENFYLAHCPQGILGVHTFGRVILEDVYPGIDWVIYSNKTGIEYDFIVHPNADPNQIRLKVTDADGVIITDKGELRISTSLGTVQESGPVSFTGTDIVATRFHKNSDGTIGFKTGAYNTAKDLRIDPSVSWSTYFGGAGLDAGYKCVTDASGNIYFAGTTASASGIASAGGFQTTFGGNNNQDAFLVKFSPSGARLWSTYYGGSDYEDGFSCTTDVTGNVYLAGSTASTSGIATSGSYKSSFGNGLVDAYLVKFNSSGARQWGTYFGGNISVDGYDCVADASGNIYLSGHGNSTSGIASPGAYQTTYGGGNNDAYLAKFNSAGTFQWSTYFGGPDDDQCYASAIDHAGNVYLTGITRSISAIATTGAYQVSKSGALDAYLVQFNSAGARAWGTYLGGSSDETGFAVACDASNNIFLAGSTKSSTGIASAGAFQTAFGGNSDFFLEKFNNTGSRLWGTYLGGPGADWGNACTTDASGNVYVSGQSTSTSGIASGGSQNTSGGGNDAVLAKFNSSGVRQWATYFGGPGDDRSLACTTDPSGYIILAGMTSSLSGVATTSGFQQTYGGDLYDTFIAKFSPSSSAVPVMGTGIGWSVSPNPVQEVLTLNFNLVSAQTLWYSISDVTGHIQATSAPVM